MPGPHDRSESTGVDVAASPWATAGPVAHTESVSLVDGTTFVVTSPTGLIGTDPSHGLFVLDTRILSRWVLEVREWHLSALTYAPSSPFAGTFVARIDRADGSDAPMVLVQRRHVAGGLHEEIEIRNHGGTERDLVVRLHVAADFASLFEVKAAHVTGRVAAPRVVATEHGIAFECDDPDVPISRVDAISTAPPSTVDVTTGTLSWSIHLAPADRWSTAFEVGVTGRDGAPFTPGRSGGPPGDRLRSWRDRIATCETDDRWLGHVVERSLQDLGSLRIVDPDHSDRVVVAAGSPWFMALFGRDSLLASWMALPFDQELAWGVLAELADAQGTQVVAETDEQPGRILHEVRFDAVSARLLGGVNRYYGSIDATPLFVMLTAELARWAGVTERVRALVPAVDRAMEWIDRFGDRDGDGFVEYLRGHPRGLEHQGWKDSWDGVRHADGSVAEPPIALCEVQGYVYAALRGRAALARACGDEEGGVDLDRRADDLARRFDEAFWLPERGHYAVGLDAAKRPIASLTSNLGHLLWTGIVPVHRARRIAAALTRPVMSSGFGLRTLARDEPGYNPLAYHCGAVWPHDTAIAVAGLGRYGFDAEAQALATALLDAARVDDGRLPELFGGFDRDDIGVPVPYPTSCSPQAWAAAAPLLVVRTLLGVEPDVPLGRVRLRPRVPVATGRIALRGVPIGGGRVDIEARGRTARLDAPGLEVVIV